MLQEARKVLVLRSRREEEAFLIEGVVGSEMTPDHRKETWIANTEIEPTIDHLRDLSETTAAKMGTASMIATTEENSAETVDLTRVAEMVSVVVVVGEEAIAMSHHEEAHLRKEETNQETTLHHITTVAEAVIVAVGATIRPSVVDVVAEAAIAALLTTDTPIVVAVARLHH